MKAVRVLLLYGFFVCAFLALIFVGQKVSTTLFGVGSCACEVSAQMAQATQMSVNEYVQNHKSTNAQQLIAEVKKTFPFVNTVQITYQPGNCMQIELTAYVPFLVINDEYALLENGTLIEKDLFVPDVVAWLPSVKINEQLVTGNELPDHLVDLFKKNTRTLYDKYALVLESENQIFLHHKTQPHFIIVSDAQTILDYSLLEHCNDLKEELDARGSFEHTPHDWVADIRFDRQIVLRADRGKHGKSIS